MGMFRYPSSTAAGLRVLSGSAQDEVHQGGNTRPAGGGREAGARAGTRGHGQKSLLGQGYQVACGQTWPTLYFCE